MPLGFSVETLLSDARVSGPLRMGLVRLAESEWLANDPDLRPRNAIFDAHSEAVQVYPEARSAEAELCEMLGVAGGIEQAARAHWEDFCLLTQDVPGAPFRLTGAAVAFPTDWQLSEKMGKAVDAVNGALQLDENPESVKQAAVADRILVTKTDMIQGPNPDRLPNR